MRGVSVTNGDSFHEDPAPADAVIKAHYERLRRLCRLLLADRQEADEVVQEVFVKALETARTGGRPKDWDRWLTRVAVNACRDRRRAGWWRRFRWATDPIDQVHIEADARDPDRAAMDAELRDRIWDVYRRLPERQQQVFVLRQVEQWSTDEVADALGITPGSVKRHLFRAIRQLRVGLGGDR